MQMTQEEPSKPEKANWNDAETEAFLDYLIQNKSKLASTSFKALTLNDAAADLHNKNLKTRGAMKTGIHCRHKWNAVCASHPTQPPPPPY